MCDKIEIENLKQDKIIKYKNKRNVYLNFHLMIDGFGVETLTAYEDKMIKEGSTYVTHGFASHAQ